MAPLFSDDKHARAECGAAPVNPLTGQPNTPGSPDPANPVPLNFDPMTGEPLSAAARAQAARRANGAARSSSGTGFDTAPTVRLDRDQQPASEPSSQPAAQTGGAGFASSDAPDAGSPQHAVPSPDREPVRTEMPLWLRRLFNSRLTAFIILCLLSLTLLSGNLLLLVAALVGGYVLLDRFVEVRHAIVIGGAAWYLMILAGGAVRAALPGVFLDFRWVFMFLGFVAALATCGLYFGLRAAWRRGHDAGRAEADRAIAGHLVDRLIEHPDDWSGLDSDFLEVEAALNRVRARERTSEQALRDEARRKDDLVTYLAHDLKTPLASVVGYLSLLNDAPDLPQEQRARFTGVALDKAHRLDALIEEFFDITRFDFHDIVLTRGYVDLNLMLAQVADEFYPTLSEQNKTVALDVPLGLTVLVDGDKMARVFNNVMKNAIAYSYEGSEIVVSASQDADGTTVIRFTNHGDPIPRAKLDVIFEKFYRLDAARTTNRGGAGLGLAIAKEIVGAHGGTIACTSDAEATVFTITLPA